jgi:ferrous iron transport protein B
MEGQLDIIYDDVIEDAVEGIIRELHHDYILSAKAVALLLLQEDPDITGKVKEKEGESFEAISSIVSCTREKFDKPLAYVIALARQKNVNELTSSMVTQKAHGDRSISDTLSRLTMNPVTGVPILLLVLYFGLYKFVGQFGAGTIVNFLEEKVFGAYINPWVNNIVSTYIHWGWLQELLARDYGIITLGIRYAVAIVLPIVGTFFLVFSIIEDSGYLPRLAMLVDRVFKKIGLNGRAVIPMTLGFGCDTMATMVSRTLETKRERVIATLLLALAIPCSAQLGVILGLLSSSPGALFVWIVFIALVFLLVGYLASKILPGEKPGFYMEVPPMRLPKLSNVLVKTYTRIQWYLMEVMPIFILVSVLIWFGNMTGLFQLAINAAEPVVKFMGLPPDAARAFIFGFFRRDYGAAGLYDLQKSGILSPRQLVVAASTLTLFVPCVAQFVMMAKERGIKTAAAIAAFILPFSITAGFLLNWVLLALGVLS